MDKIKTFSETITSGHESEPVVLDEPSEVWEQRTFSESISTSDKDLFGWSSLIITMMKRRIMARLEVDDREAQRLINVAKNEPSALDDEQAKAMLDILPKKKGEKWWKALEARVKEIE